MKVLVTGGAGYIGSTVASACEDAGIQPVLLDSLVTGRREFVLGRPFYQGDIADGELLDRAFADHPEIAAVVHCAALVVVAESLAEPLRYYRENVSKTLALVEHLLRNGCDRFVFSSSASIYSSERGGMVDEGSPIAPGSPYARTKWMVETALADVAAAGGLRVISLRYFNPVGADPQLRTGVHNLEPSHVLGKLVEANRTGVPFRLTGVDWPTRDGSAIRDYIHVWDLAQAHLGAFTRFDQLLPPGPAGGYEVVNLGTGQGTTVRELLGAFELVVGRQLAVEECPPRPGDTLGCYTDGGKARRLLGWEARLTIEEAVRHALQWSERWRSLLGAGTPVG